MRRILLCGVFVLVGFALISLAFSDEQAPELKEYFSTVQGVRCQKCLYEYIVLYSAGLGSINGHKYCVALEYLQSSRGKMLDCEMLCPIYIRNKIYEEKSWVGVKDELDRLIQQVDNACRGR